MKWSEQEKDYKCEGVDRAFRTFERIVDHAVADDSAEAERKAAMEAVVVRQVPRALQSEMAEKLKNDKAYEESLRIGNKRRSGAADGASSNQNDKSASKIGDK